MSRQHFVNFFQVASLVMLLVAVALLSAVTTMHFAIHGVEVKVPALKGMTVAEARSQTSGLGLNLDVDNRYYSGDVAAGHILSQSPAPGTVVRREWRVRVAESLGPQKVEVPETVGLDERVAALRLQARGAGGGRDGAAALGQGGRGNGAGPGPAGARPGHCATQHRPAGGRAGGQRARRLCDARPDRPAGGDGAGGVAQVGIQSADPVCGCAGGAGGRGQRGPRAAGEAGRGDGAAARGRHARGAERAGEADGGEVRREWIRRD